MVQRGIPRANRIRPWFRLALATTRRGNWCDKNNTTSIVGICWDNLPYNGRTRRSQRSVADSLRPYAPTVKKRVRGPRARAFKTGVSRPKHWARSVASEVWRLPLPTSKTTRKRFRRANSNNLYIPALPSVGWDEPKSYSWIRGLRGRLVAGIGN